MIKNWYNQVPYPALKTKREITKYINDSSLRKARALTERTAISQTGDHLAARGFLKYVTNIIGEPNYKYGQQEQVTMPDKKNARYLHLYRKAFFPVSPLMQHSNLNFECFSTALHYTKNKIAEI